MPQHIISSFVTLALFNLMTLSSSRMSPVAKIRSPYSIPRGCRFEAQALSWPFMALSTQRNEKVKSMAGAGEEWLCRICLGSYQ
eukprot:scaffold16250_cov84-Skeletonema_dohrnii-CCMP3373.AAC.3